MADSQKQLTTAKVMPCHCAHKVQDEMYGKGMRVHNFGKKKNKGQGGWACTVCSSIKS